MKLERRSATPEVQENCGQQIQKECILGISIGNPWIANYQPGGTLATVTCQWTQNVTLHGSDPKLGRWSWVTFKGKGTSQTTFIMAYRVCDQTPITQDCVYGPLRAMESGTKLRTAHTQQVSLLLEDNAECCDPRQAFITYLEKFITSLTIMSYSEEMPMRRSMTKSRSSD
jgi:hypothetical protein